MSLGLDLSSVQENAPVPVGTYNVVVEKAEVKSTSTGGEMIKIQLKISDGPLAGRNVFEQFNIKNASPQAQNIGLAQLKSMLKAFGHPNPNRLESVIELQGLRGRIVTKIEEQEGYSPQARVKAYQAGTTPITASGGNSNPFA